MFCDDLHVRFIFVGGIMNMSRALRIVMVPKCDQCEHFAVPHGSNNAAKLVERVRDVLSTEGAPGRHHCLKVLWN